jgi:hypothetical protein
MDSDECFCLHFMCARLVQHANKLAGTFSGFAHPLHLSNELTTAGLKASLNECTPLAYLSKAT